MNKKLKTSLLGLCILTTAVAVVMQGTLFAATEVPATAQATVAPEGHFAPIIDAQDQTMREGEVLQFEVLATDPNIEDQVFLEITQGQPPWLEIISNIPAPPGGTARMTLEAAPPVGTIGNYKVYFKATDDSEPPLSTTKFIYITVNPMNQAPVISGEDQNVQVGEFLMFTVSAEDPDTHHTVTMEFSGVPAWLTPSDTSPVTGNPTDVTFTGTPQAADVDIYTISFFAYDDGTPQQSALLDVNITVSVQNDPPILNPIRDKEVPVRVTLEFTVSATDPNGDSLDYDALNLPGDADFTNQTFNWTPAIKDVGDHPVTFTVFDGHVTVSEDITITVTPQEAPIFSPLRDQYGKIGELLMFVVTARDPNDDPITYGASNLPAGANFDLITHTFTWTPQPGQEGDHMDVTFTASDGISTTVASIWIHVNGATAPDLLPVSPPYVDLEVRVGNTLSVTLEATDPDTHPSQLIFSVSNPPPGSVLLGSNFGWAPFESQVGTYPDVVFYVSDGVDADFETVQIVVTSANAPILDRISPPYVMKQVVEGRTLSFTVNATDPNGDPLFYSASNLPAGAVFDTVTHTFTWTPAIGERGIYRNIIFSVTDGAYTDSESIWIEVIANSAPVVDPLINRNVRVGEELSFAISAYDPEGDSLTYTALNLPLGATFVNRTFRWTPTADQVGTYNNIMFEVTDGINIVTRAMGITVFASGAPVIADIGEKHLTAGVPFSFIIPASDPDQDSLMFTSRNVPAGASIVDNGNNTATFSWGNPQIGIFERVTVIVTDGTYTDDETFWVFVKAPGAPVIDVPGEPYIDHHIRVGELLQFVVTATDPDTPLGQLTYSATNLPPGSTFVNQVFSWTPVPGQVGTYPRVTFTVSDGTYSDSDATWIFVTASGAPEFTQDIITKYGRIGEPIVFTVSATDPDHDPSLLTYSAYNLPPNATFTDQTFRWTPQAGQAGTYPHVHLEVVDPDNNIDADSFWIFIVENSPPELDFIGTQYGAAGTPLEFTVFASDPDGDDLDLNASGLPGDATFVDNDNNTGTFTWTNPVDGTYTNVHFEVTDGALTDSEDITIEISP